MTDGKTGDTNLRRLPPAMFRSGLSDVAIGLLSD